MNFIEVRDGWLAVPYEGPDAALVEIGVGSSEERAVWAPAFLDFEEGQRVAKVRPPLAVAGRTVWLRVSGAASRAGSLR